MPCFWGGMKGNRIKRFPKLVLSKKKERDFHLRLKREFWETLFECEEWKWMLHYITSVWCIIVNSHQEQGEEKRRYILITLSSLFSLRSSLSFMMMIVFMIWEKDRYFSAEKRRTQTKMPECLLRPCTHIIEWSLFVISQDMRRRRYFWDASDHHRDAFDEESPRIRETLLTLRDSWHAKGESVSYHVCLIRKKKDALSIWDVTSQLVSVFRDIMWAQLS